MNERDLAITGMACLFPGSLSLNAYWSNLTAGRDFVGEVPADRWTHMDWLREDYADAHGLPNPQRGAFLPSDLSIDPMKYGVLPHAVQHGDPDQFVMLQVVAGALADAGIGDGAAVRARTDLIVGHGGYSSPKALETIYRAQGFDEVLQLIGKGFPELLANGRHEEVRAYLRGCLPPNEVEALATVMPNIIACRSANRLGLGGAAYLVDGACSSSLLAVEQAAVRLRQGMADAVVAGGIFMTNYIPFWHIFSCLGALSPDGQIRPMDRRANGLVVGEGAGAVVLKRLSDAVRDGDQIYAILKGVGSSSNGREVNVLAPSTAGQLLAVRRAYEDAQMEPDSIGYLELHGTATVAGDTTEVQTVGEFFGPNRGRYCRFMGSVKSMIGHAMPASGMASLIKVALSLSNKILPPSLHCEDPRPEVAQSDFCVNTELRPWVQDRLAGPRRGAINSFGFGGINVHAVLEEVVVPAGADDRVALPRPVRVVQEWPAELFVFSAGSRQGLLSRLATVKTALTDGRAWRLIDVACQLSKELNLDDPVKLTLVCATSVDLLARIQTCLDRLAKPDGKLIGLPGVEYSETANTRLGKIGVVFPGNAFPGIVGEFPGHLKQLSLHFPCVRHEVDHLSARDRLPEDPIPLESILWPPAGMPEELKENQKRRLQAIALEEAASGVESLPTTRQLDALAMAMSNWMRWEMLQELEVPVEMVTGLSLGEMTASCAAGCFDYHEVIIPYLQATMGIATAMLQSSDCRMLFLFVPEDRFRQLQADFPSIRVSIGLASDAVCVAGPQDDLRAIEQQVREEGLISKLLPFPPVHTEYFETARQMLEQAFDARTVHCEAARIPLYSTFLVGAYPTDPDEIRSLLYRNLVEPLRIPQTMRLMYDDGVRILIQAGIGQLSTLSSGILPPGAKLNAVAIDVEAVDPVVHFQRMCGQLLTWGVPVSLEMLYRHRHVEPVSLAVPAPAAGRPRHEMRLRMDWSPLEQAEHPIPHETEEATVPVPVEVLEAVEEVPLIEEGVDTSVEIPEEVLAMAANLPLIGTIVDYAPDEQLVCERTYSLEEDLYLLDHLFIYAPDVKPPEERWPVVPMSFSLEMFAEVGALLSPGLGMVGLADVRMSRWVDVVESGPKTVRATGRVVDESAEVRRVEVEIEYNGVRLAKGASLFAAEYREDISDLAIVPVPDVPWPVTAEQTYEEGLMFHGPKLQVIAQLDGFGDTSFSGHLAVLPKDELFTSHPEPLLLTDPCLMDGISQICGLWLQMKDANVFPTGVEQVEFYGPTPPVGSAVFCRFQLASFEPETKQYRFDGEVEDGEGGLWMRVRGWCDWLFPYSARFTFWTLRPGELLLAEEIELPAAEADAVCVFLSRMEVRIAGLERAWRTSLTRREADEILAIPSEDGQRDFVISRIAAKDAVRLWWERTLQVRNIHPASIEIQKLPSGQPVVTNTLDLPNPQISLSHSKRGAVAMVSRMPVGVDLESANGPAAGLHDQFLDGEEQLLIANVSQRDPSGDWSTRAWCAKEAAGKWLGTGLDGRPKSLSIVDLDTDGSMLIRAVRTGDDVRVASAEFDGMVLAWSLPPNAILTEQADSQ